MSLSDITREAVLKSINEFDTLGKTVFLQRYGFYDARKYFLVFQGREYPSKAIVGVSYKFIGGEYRPLLASEFHGGANTVKPLLEKLGFIVVVKNPVQKRV